MAYKVFLDTNIVLDIFYQDRPFFQDAVELFNHLDKNKFKAFYSESVIASMAYILRKTMNARQVNEVIADLSKKINVLPCFQPLIAGSLLHDPVDFEDSLLYEIALHHQVDYFITSNTRDFRKIHRPALPVLKTKDFNKLLRE